MLDRKYALVHEHYVPGGDWGGGGFNYNDGARGRAHELNPATLTKKERIRGVHHAFHAAT